MFPDDEPIPGFPDSSLSNVERCLRTGFIDFGSVDRRATILMSIPKHCSEDHRRQIGRVNAMIWPSSEEHIHAVRCMATSSTSSSSFHDVKEIQDVQNEKEDSLDKIESTLLQKRRKRLLSFKLKEAVKHDSLSFNRSVFATIRDGIMSYISEIFPTTQQLHDFAVTEKKLIRVCQLMPTLSGILPGSETHRSQVLKSPSTRQMDTLNALFDLLESFSFCPEIDIPFSPPRSPTLSPEKPPRRVIPQKEAFSNFLKLRDQQSTSSSAELFGKSFIYCFLDCFFFSHHIF